MLQNASLLAIVAVDTEENELSKVLSFYYYFIFIQPRDLIFTYVPLPVPRTHDAHVDEFVKHIA